MTVVAEYAAMDDPELIGERARIRAELERLSPRSDTWLCLRSRYDATTQEIDHRARLAWSTSWSQFLHDLHWVAYCGRCCSSFVAKLLRRGFA